MSEPREIPSVEHFEWFLEKQRLLVEIREAFARFGVVPPSESIDRIIDAPSIRDAIIVGIYNTERRRGVKAEYLYCVLGDSFGLSQSAVRDIVYCKCKNCANVTL